MAGTSTIPNYFVQQWDTSIRETAQQRDSRLLSRVTDRGTIVGDAFTINTEGTVEFEPNLVRHSDTEWSEILHTARLVSMQDFFTAIPLDRNDIPKMLVNPVTGGNYMAQLMNAKNRKIDSIIYAAALGTQPYKDGTSVALPSSQKIAAGGTGLTKAKVIQALTLFRANEADDYSGEDITILYNSVAMGEILGDTTLTNNQFLAGQMLQSGKIAQNWLGATWIPYEKLNNVSGTYSTVMFAKSGIEFGRGFEEGDVSKRPDKKNLWQVSMAASYGAGRQDEAKVVQIDFV